MIARAIIRADASPEIGGGHIVRCLAFANELAMAGWACTFATGPQSLATVRVLWTAGYDIIELPGDASPAQEAEIISAACQGGVDLVVVDHYQRDIEFERACRPWSKRIMVIDDLMDRRHDCDILVNIALDRTLEDYDGLVPRLCPILLGPQYALLRPEFAHKRRGRARNSNPHGRKLRLFVGMGASDPHDITSKIIQALASFRILPDVDIVLGTSSPNLARIEDLVTKMNSEIRLHVDSTNIAELMASADIAIGAPGGMSWERCAIGLATIIIATADNQLPNAASLARRGCAKFLGMHDKVSADDISQALEHLLEDTDALQDMADKAAELCDGKGALRCVLALHSIFTARDDATVSIRLVESRDSDLIYQWQSHVTTRRYFHNSSAPGYQEHQKWFQNRLSNAADITLMIEDKGEPAGLLRLDKSETPNSYVVSILVSPDMKRRGIALAGLRLTRQLRPRADLLAEVHSENNASHRLFQKAGYHCKEDGLYINPAGSLQSSTHADQAGAGT